MKAKLPLINVNRKFLHSTTVSTSIIAPYEVLTFTLRLKIDIYLWALIFISTLTWRLFRRLNLKPLGVDVITLTKLIINLGLINIRYVIVLLRYN